jgi:mRNA interferase MazF
MTPKRGDVVLVRFPFSSGSGGKLRPALVVQNDRNNRRLANVILAAITTRTHHAGEPTQLLVDPASTDGRSSGLKHVSCVSCENLATVEQQLIVRRLGHLPEAVMRQVNECLINSLDIA